MTPDQITARLAQVTERYEYHLARAELMASKAAFEGSNSQARSLASRSSAHAALAGVYFGEMRHLRDDASAALESR